MKRLPRISIFELFIIATGIAAFIHSTWAVATYFGGPEPDQWTPHWWGWMIMGGLVAFAMDVGQVATSALIRAGHNAQGYKITFAVFALATYFTQFLYVIAHVPQVQLAPGVAEQYRTIASAIRDAAIFIFPALLPASTFLYTFSQNAAPARVKPATVSTKWTVQESPSESPIEPPLLAPASALQLFDAKCEECEWFGEGYKSQIGADRALRAHKQHAHKEV
jgi:hypothetical protein